MLRMITVESLTKTYGRGLTAVDDVSFTAATGRVTGFLGPNGAGKSTTMRIMVGLTPATSGTATIDGRRFVDLPNPGIEVGVLLDASAQHAGRTGREILTLVQRTMGLPRSRVKEMLDLVSLTDDEADRTVLLSSHLLHEIEVIADDLVVIGNGRIVAQGTKAELLASAGTIARA